LLLHDMNSERVEERPAVRRAVNQAAGRPMAATLASTDRGGKRGIRPHRACQAGAPTASPSWPSVCPGGPSGGMVSLHRLPLGLRDAAEKRLAAAGADANDDAVLEQAFVLEPAAARQVLDATVKSGNVSELEERVFARLMARYAPDALAELLLAVSADLLESPHLPLGRLAYWIDDVDAADGQLFIWRAIMTGIRLADEDKTRSGSAVTALRGTAAAHDDPAVELWRALARAVALDDYSAGLRAIGAARRLREIAYAAPHAWAQTLPWLFKAGRRAEHHVATITAELWTISSEVRDAVDAAVRHNDDDVRLAAEGIRQTVGADGPASATALADLATRALDRTVFAAPTPLGAPSATWLADLGFEATLRSGARAAVARAAGHFTAMPSTNEEGHVGHLVATLTAALEAVLPEAVRAAAGQAGPKLTISSRINGNPEEKSTGADLALVVNVDVRGALEIEFAEAVQVKKTARLHDDYDRDQWTIKNKQLQDLLDRSPTAVYWLLANDGNVLVVPAKLLGPRVGNG